MTALSNISDNTLPKMIRLFKIAQFLKTLEPNLTRFVTKGGALRLRQNQGLDTEFCSWTTITPYKR